MSQRTGPTRLAGLGEIYPSHTEESVFDLFATVPPKLRELATRLGTAGR